MPYLFTSESVSAGHPDKIADQISDTILDHFLALDPQAKVACETLVTTGQVILAGEVHANCYVDVQKITREIIAEIGYNHSDYMFDANSCGILSAIHEQSIDIRRGIQKQEFSSQGAGDQGMMFGYATDETANYMPLGLEIAHRILIELAKIRKEKTIPYLRPDAKSQVTIAYSEDHQPLYIDTIVISTQHDPFLEDDEAMLAQIKKDLINLLIPKVIPFFDPKIQNLFNAKIQYHINPTGKFVIGGPHGDTGLTGRKIIVDTYGGKGAHGGGAFSGKDPSKVDRSAAYACRHIAKNLVAAGVAKEILVQVAYAIGVAEPVSFYVNTNGTNRTAFSDAQIAEKIKTIFDMRPAAIEQRLQLRKPIYKETAAYGHMGRISEEKFFNYTDAKGETQKMPITTFTWEKLDFVKIIQEQFKL